MIIYQAFSALSRFLFFVSYIRIKISGLENIPRDGRVVFVANHPGLLDSFFLMAKFPVRFHFLLVEGFLKIPLLGGLLKSLGCIGYSPEKKVSMARSVLAVLEKGEPLLIFPERPREAGELLADFKSGAVAIARACGALVVPVVIKGSEKVAPKDSVIISPGVVYVRVGQPIRPEEITDADLVSRKLKAYFREVIEKEK